MGCKFTDLRQKEVINLCDGRRLGCICDIILDTCNGKVEAIIVPGQIGFAGFFKGSKEIIIPWCKICKFGDDVILVDIEGGTDIKKV